MQSNPTVHAQYRGRALVGARVAGFGRRLMGEVIDKALVIGLSVLVVRLLDNGVRPLYQLWAAALAIQLLYYIWGYGDGQTVGCMLTGMRIVTDRTGVEPGYRLGLARWLFANISAVPFAAGYFWMLFDNKHQTWHDKACGTVVIINDGLRDPFWDPQH
jgi:uncharacterized RDD family membrane protein YckC